MQSLLSELQRNVSVVWVTINMSLTDDIRIVDLNQWTAMDESVSRLGDCTMHYYGNDGQSDNLVV